MKIRASAGFSLLDLMLAVGLASVLALGMSAVMSHNQAMFIGAKVASNRDNLGTYLNTLARNYNTILFSAQFAPNRELWNCLNPGNGNDTPDPSLICSAGVHDFYLFDPHESAQSATSARGAPNPNPSGPGGALYTIDGALCRSGPGAPNRSCPLSVHTYFSAVCPVSGAASCFRAQTVTVFFEIKRAPAQGPGAVPVSAAIPLFANIMNGNGHVFDLSSAGSNQLCDTATPAMTGMGVNDAPECMPPLQAATTTQCNLGEALSQIDAYGNIKCTKFAAATSATCPNNQYLNGINPDGSLICYPFIAP